MPEVLFEFPVILLIFIWHPNTKGVWPVLVNVAMRLTRRNTLIGLGAAAAGAGAIGGTGAFTSVTAERTVSVSTTGDDEAALALEAAGTSNSDDYVTTVDETVQINIDGGNGLNKDAKTTIEGLITVTNNGSEEIDTLSLSMSLADADGLNTDNVFKFTSSEVSSTIQSEEDISDGGLGSGSDLDFGMVIDLLPDTNTGRNSGEANALPDTEYTLEIKAETA